MESKIDMKFFLLYEIRSSSWASYIGWNWLQELVSMYFVWKVKRKYTRYVMSIHREKMIKDETREKKIR